MRAHACISDPIFFAMALMLSQFLAAIPIGGKCLLPDLLTQVPG
jgi:hypothetical protein